MHFPTLLDTRPLASYLLKRKFISFIHPKKSNRLIFSSYMQKMQLILVDLKRLDKENVNKSYKTVIPVLNRK